MPDLEKLQHRATVGLDFPRIGPKIAVPDSVATKADLKAAIAEVKADMLKTAIAVVVANVSLTVALIKLL